MSEAIAYRNIFGNPGYRVGDDGSFWSCTLNSQRLTDHWRRLVVSAAPGKTRLRIPLRVHGKPTMFMAHRLVLEMFVGPCPPKHETRFRDGDPCNIQLSNLCWSPREEIRFWDRIKKMPSGCWEWQGAKTIANYGKIKFGGVFYGTHRLAYILAVSPIHDDLHVLHRCDNPPCCRPDHLFLGTNYDNVQDMISKGRKRNVAAPPERRCRGVDRKDSKLVDADVIEIRRRYAVGGITMKELGNDYGVNATNIFYIVHRKTWGHVG